MSQNNTSTGGTVSEYPKRRRWDGDRDNLAYEVEDNVEDGESAVIQWVREDDDSVVTIENVEIGTFESHNSWLSMFVGDQGVMYHARPDGVLLKDSPNDREINEIGEVKRVVRAVDVGDELLGADSNE